MEAKRIGDWPDDDGDCGVLIDFGDHDRRVLYVRDEATALVLTRRINTPSEERQVPGGTMTERPDTAALREQLRDVLNMATLRRDQSLALLDFIDSLPASRPVSPEGRWVPAAELDALAAAVNEDGGTVAAYRANVTGRAAALVRATRHMPDADVPERGWAIHEPDEFRPRLEAGETTCPEGTCDGCPDPDACAALRPAPIPATEGRSEGDEPTGPAWLRQALDIQTALLEDARMALEMTKDRLDEFTYSELAAPLDDSALDEFGEAYRSERNRLREEVAELRAASPSAGTVQPDPEGLVVLRRSDVEALCEEWADLDEDPFWRPQPLPELLTLARDAVEACARNIAETGEWGIDALNKARAALAALGSSEGEDG